jgi:ubiquinone/menaquinone biosynthesis C-methylase UbiE
MVSWFSLKRIPEPELMDEDAEVGAYADAAAEAYLEAIDRSFVDQVERLLEPASGGRPIGGAALDIGCGPGQIPIMMARRWPALRITGLDAGPAMIQRARNDAAAAGVDIDFRVFRLGPRGEPRLPFDDASFDLVTCNSTLHHLDDPLGLLNEMARVVKPEGAILLRDLARPAIALAYPLHVCIFGRHYSGEMRRLYELSVLAAYTMRELGALLASSKLNDGRSRVFKRGLTHLGIEREALAVMST